MRRVEHFSKKIFFGILLQSALTIVPIILLIFYISIRTYSDAKELQVQKMMNSVSLIASEQSQILEGARQLLIALSTTNQIKFPDRNCSNYLAEVLSNYQRYTNIALVDINGNVVCSATAPQTAVNIADRYFFKSMVESKNFTIGEYSVSKITQDSIISFAYPVFGNNDVFKGVVYSSLNLQWLNNLIGNLKVGEQTTLVILDRNGVVLANGYNSESEIGKVYPVEDLNTHLKGGLGFFEANNGDGNTFYYSFQEIDQNDNGPFVVMGLPKKAIYSEPIKHLVNDFLIVILIGLVSIFTGLLLGRRLINSVLSARSKVEQLKKDFVSLVSHQLRTPLTAVKYFQEILLSESTGKLKPKQREFLTDSLSSVNKLISLVGMLLNISKLESGKIELNLEETSLLDLIINCQAEVEKTFVHKKNKYIIPSKNNRKILIDEKLMGQVIANLLTNAVKYSKSGSKIEIKVINQKEAVKVCVTNDGIVILDEERDNIFSKFFRSEAAQKEDQEGSGLGLYLCKLIVELHGGKIGFTSSKRFGTTFFFTIPY